MPLLLACLSAVSACIPLSPKAPKGWHGTKVENPAPLFDDQERHSILFQLLFGYRRVWGHSALRLIGPGDHKIFWDPGSHYGDSKRLNIKRIKDVIFEHDVPSIMTYMNYRYDEAALLETHFTVMEWYISDDTAADMRRVLIHGYDPENEPEPPPLEKFQTDVPTFFCSAAMCEFLQKYGRNEITASKTYNYPHHLLNELWHTHPPQRVIVFNSDRTATVYLPPDTRQPTACDNP